jgi:RimJ/RimL family protein N-acetyltransferase
VNRGLKTPLVLTRCTIRGWRADDAADLARHANDTGVAANLRDAFPDPYTVDDANIFLARVIIDQPIINFYLDIGGRAAGGIGLRLGSDIHRRTAEFGYWLGRAYWNRGIMSEAVGASAMPHSKRSIFADCTPNRSRTTGPRREYWKKPVLFSRGD